MLCTICCSIFTARLVLGTIEH